MKIIEIDEELYQYLAANTKSIGESASDILRRLLKLSSAKPAVKNKLAVDSTEKSTHLQQPQQAELIEKSELISAQSRKKQSKEAIQRVVGRVNSVVQSEDFQQENKGVVRFLMILTALYRSNPESFAQAAESLQGRTRIYFARDEATLLQAGNHTKPKQIPETPYWVITNTNSQRKMLMLEGAMNSMHLPSELVEEVRNYFSV